MTDAAQLSRRAFLQGSLGVLTLAVTAKDIAVRFPGPGSRRGERITLGVEIVAALFLVLMGLSLLGASLQI